jgi:hypothetical protein
MTRKKDTRPAKEQASLPLTENDFFRDIETLGRKGTKFFTQKWKEWEDVEEYFYHLVEHHGKRFIIHLYDNQGRFRTSTKTEFLGRTQKEWLKKILQEGKEKYNKGSVTEMHYQHTNLQAWIDSFADMVPDADKRPFEREEIYRALPVEILEKLSQAFQAIGNGQFKPSVDLAEALSSQARYRRERAYGMIRP